MKKLISFFENSGCVINGATCKDISIIGLTELQLDWLSDLKVQVGTTTLPVFKISRKTIQATHAVGYFSGAGLNVQVLPKIYNHSDNPEAECKSALSNLLFMLSKSWEVNIWTGDNAAQSETPDSMLDAIISVYVRHLKTYINLGLKMDYIEFSDPTTQVKGKLIFSGALYEPKSTVHPNCSWDEWSANTPLNKAILRLSEILANKAISPRLKDTLTSTCARLRQTIGSSKCLRPLLDQSLKLHNLNHSKFFRVAQFLARSVSPSLSEGAKDQISIGFDMNHLFEAYLYSLLSRYKLQLGIKKIEYQFGRRLISQFVESHEEAPTSIKLRNTFTDLILICEDGNRYVVDAKYKMTDSDSKSFGISNADIYQITTYQRLHHKNDQDAVGLLIFPRSQDDICRYFKLNTEVQLWFGCHSINLNCDLKKSENEIVKRIYRSLLKGRELQKGA